MSLIELELMVNAIIWPMALSAIDTVWVVAVCCLQTSPNLMHAAESMTVSRLTQWMRPSHLQFTQVDQTVS